MPNPITDVDDFTTTCQSQADGEPANSTAELLAHQGVADRTRNLHNRSLNAKGGELYLPLLEFERMASSAEWSFNDDSNTTIANVGLLQTAINPTGTPNEALWWEIPRHWLSLQITRITALYNGLGGPASTHAGLPTVMPRIRLLRIDHAAADRAVVGTTTASHVSVAAYEQWNELTIASLTQTFDVTKRYFVEWRGEGNTNSKPHVLLLAGISATVAPS